MEDELLLSFFSAAPAVLRVTGMPNDVEQIRLKLRAAVASRPGLRRESRCRLIEAFKALSAFQAGYMTVEKLEHGMAVAAEGLSGRNGRAPVTVTLNDLKASAADILRFSKNSQKPSSSSESESSPIQHGKLDLFITQKQPSSPIQHGKLDLFITQKQPSSPIQHGKLDLFITQKQPSSPIQPGKLDFLPLLPSSSSSSDASDVEPMSPPPKQRQFRGTTTRPVELPSRKRTTSHEDSISSSVGSSSSGYLSPPPHESVLKKTIEIDVPPHKLEKLVGSQGNTIHQIQAVTGAQLSVYKDTSEKVLLITGTSRQCSEARMMVMNLLKAADSLDGALYRLPFGFFDQWVDGKLGALAEQTGCKLRPLKDVCSGLNFIFICGSLRSDIECCKEALSKWERQYLQERNCNTHKCTVIDANTPSTFQSVGKRMCYSREELISLWTQGHLPDFSQAAVSLGIIQKDEAPRCPSSMSVCSSPDPQSASSSQGHWSPFWNPTRASNWVRRLNTRADDKWEHDMFQA